MKAINMLKMLNGKCHGLPYSVVFNIFDTTVLPVLTYASEVWGYKLHQNVENVQIRFCRYLLGVGSRTPNVAVLGECGRLPIFVHTYINCIKLGEIN